MIDRAEGDTDRGIGAMTNRNQMKGRERPQREDISKYIISFALQMSPSASVEQPCSVARPKISQNEILNFHFFRFAASLAASPHHSHLCAIALR